MMKNKPVKISPHKNEFGDLKFYVLVRGQHKGDFYSIADARKALAKARKERKLERNMPTWTPPPKKRRRRFGVG